MGSRKRFFCLIGIGLVCSIAKRLTEMVGPYKLLLAQQVISVSKATTAKNTTTTTTSIESSYQHKAGAVCMQQGRFYGRSFNRFLTLAHMVDYARSRNLDVFLEPEHYNWYKTEWLDLQNNTANLRLDQQQPQQPLNMPRILQMSPHEPLLQDATSAAVQTFPSSPSPPPSSCTFTMSSKDWFFGNKINASYVGVQPSMDLLWPLVRPTYLQQAAEQLQTYRAARAVVLGHNNTAKIRTITVHSRGMEGACVKRMRKPEFVVCPRPLPRPHYRHWFATCTYTYDHVYANIPPAMKQDENFVVILSADEEMMKRTAPAFVEGYADSAMIDASSFQVQVAMMVLSDLHFGNPGSTIDLVVSHWRRGRPTFPFDCYDKVLEYHKQQQQQTSST